MSTQLQQLLDQREQLEAAIAAERSKMREAGLETIRATISNLGLSIDDVMGLFPKSTPSRSQGQGSRNGALRGRKVPVKYLDPATGNSWTGRGVRPHWVREFELKGGSLASLLSSASDASS